MQIGYSLRVALGGAIVATVCLSVVFLRLLHSILTPTKVAQVNAVLQIRHERAAALMHLVIPIRLGVLVDVISSHCISPMFVSGHLNQWNYTARRAPTRCVIRSQVYFRLLFA